MNIHKTEILIIGGGIVGLCLAYQIKKQRKNTRITIIDKESKIGIHTSGRNSGVIHAGLYYPPNTLKAKVCVEGGQRLLSWCKEKRLTILKCGKVIAPQKIELDGQLDLLMERGKKNGAEVHLINEKEFLERVPNGVSASGRAIWSPNTCVVDPKEILQTLKESLEKKSVNFLLNRRIGEIYEERKEISIYTTGSTELISYDHLFNTTGLQADRIAKKFGLADNLTILPFKGIYWKLDPNSGLKFNTNFYPVPDLNIPFLGIHVTPSPDGSISLGPTAVPALGRENYYGMEGFEPIMTMGFLRDLSIQWIKNKNGFRNYAREQSLHGFKFLLFKSAQLQIPKLKFEHLLPSQKVGIRAQLYDKKKGQLVDDFIVKNTEFSTHILNSISPAFTSSFALSDEIIKLSTLKI